MIAPPWTRATRGSSAAACCGLVLCVMILLFVTDVRHVAISPSTGYHSRRRQRPDLRRRLSVGQAIAISGDRIAAIGSEADSRARSAGTVVIPLHGRTIIPGSSTRMPTWNGRPKQVRLSLAGLGAVGRSLNGSPPKPGTAEGRLDRAMQVGQPPFYFGGPDTLAEKRMPDRRELDARPPTIPSASPEYSAIGAPARLHRAEHAGPPPQRRRREPARMLRRHHRRDASGEPTGIIVERTTDHRRVRSAASGTEVLRRRSVQAIRTSMRL